MNKLNLPLKLKLTAWYTFILALTLLTLGSSLFFYLQYTLTKEIDHSLTTKAVEVFKSIKIEESYLYPLQQVILPDIDIFAATPDIYLQVVDAKGQLITKSNNLGNQVLPLDNRILTNKIHRNDYFTVYKVPKFEIRIYNLPLYFDEQLVGFLQVARPLIVVNQTLSTLKNFLLAIAFFAILIAATSGFILARSALKPIRDITKKAKQIEEVKDYSKRISYAGPKDELGELALTFNEMLQKIETNYLKLVDSYSREQRFVSDASHELRTPLTTIRGNIEYLEKVISQDDELLQEALLDIKSEAERMSRLVNDLLVLARADAGYKPELTPLNFSEFLNEVIRNTRFLDQQLKIHFQEPEWLKTTSILGDRDLLKQLFIIILDNAFKFTPKNGQIILETAKKGQNLIIKVSDTGIGIAKEDLPHIFERFYRSQNTPSGSGTGLGLSIAKWIIDIHNAKIEINSEVQRGTTVILNFSFF